MQQLTAAAAVPRYRSGMGTKYYACFILQDAATSGCRELGGVVEVDAAFTNALSFDDVAEILADDLSVGSSEVRVFHWSRLH